MKKRNLQKIFASFIMVGVVLAGCGGESTEDKQENNTPTEDQSQDNEKVEKIAIEDTATGIQIQAYKDLTTELGKAKEGQEVDWEIISTVYKEKLQGAVSEIDGIFDTAIQAQIEAGKNGELDANIVRQLIDKTTQAYFYQKQKRLHKDIVAALEGKEQSTAEGIFAELKYLAKEVLIPTAVKRDSYYELTGDKSLEQNIDAGLSAQEEALKAGNVDDMKVFVQMTDKSVYRSYYLAANSYAEKMDAAVKEGKDKLELQNMQAEAWGFYQAIKGSLSGGNEEAANEIDILFTLNTTDPATIKVDEVSSLFVKGFVGKIKGYHEKVPTALSESKLVDARVEAMEANMFLKAIELKLTDKLGQEKAQKVFEDAEKWYNAVAENNSDEATTHSKSINSILDELLK